MSDLKKVNSGEDFAPVASTYNRMIDATKFVENLRNSASKETKLDFRMDGLCYVKNSSGGRRNRFDILGIDGPLYGPRTHYQPFIQSILLNGVSPTANAHEGKFVVLAEPLISNEIGLAWCSGICPVRLDPTTIENATTHADIINGEYSQAKGCGHGAQIVWLDTADDAYDRWALIRLDGDAPIQRFTPGEQDKVAGPRDTGGVFYRVLMWMQPPGVASHSTDEDLRVIVNCQGLNAVVFPYPDSPGTPAPNERSPAYNCFAYFDGEEWTAFGGGVPTFNGTVSDVSPVKVTPVHGGDDTPDLITEVFCDEEALVGLTARVEVDNDDLLITNLCCGEEEVGT